MKFSDPIWDELIVHNGEIRDDIQCRTSTRLVEGTYGSMAQRRARESAVIEGPMDQEDAGAETSGSSEHLSATHELDPLLGVNIRTSLYVEKDVCCLVTREGERKNSEFP